MGIKLRHSMGAPQPCPHSLVIFLLNMMYTFENVNGTVKFSSPKSVLPIPSQLTGMKVTMIGHKLKIVLESVQTAIVWDTEKLIVVEASPSLWNRTGGLCGTMDMDIRNDFISKTGTQQKLARTFVDSWRTPNVDVDKSKCIMEQVEDMDVAKCDPEKKKKAESVCEKLVRSSKFVQCLEKYNTDMLIESCVSDYCFCPDSEHPEKCSCDGVSVFAQDCAFQGVELEHGWRDMEVCPLPCSDGRIYKACGPSSEPSCGVAMTNEKDAQCREGCFCPDGTIQHEGKCIDPFQCPCQLRGKSFKAGSKVKKDCNTCTCENGAWKCTDVNCGSRCGAIGDPHYVTFDGRRFDFMGKCSYRLLLTDNVTVDAENVACPGSISEAMELIPTSLDLPSCTKSVTISYKIGERVRTIKLKQGRSIFVDDQEVVKLPKTLVKGLLKIRQASSTFLSVEFQDGLKVWWDGVTRVYIDTPASYRDKTKGLCGTFNSNQQDDFLTPEGDIESVVEPFADKWRTKETCPYITDTVPVPHPCQVNLENKSKAEKDFKRLRLPRPVNMKMEGVIKWLMGKTLYFGNLKPLSAMPKCLNNGICVSPGVCTCSDNFRGPQCQYEKKICLQKPSLPSNSRQTCSSSQCTISCAKGYRFPDGTTVTNVVCKDGDWKPTRGDWPTVPDCQPVCSPKCRNGGNCLSFNVCQCPPEFRGPQCQYSVDNCAPKKLKFNGGYNCSGTGDTISCTLYCPKGVEFDSQPSPVYTCSYSKGIFSPDTVPKCVFTDDMDVISMGGYSQSTQIRTGQTYSGGSWSYSGGGRGNYCSAHTHFVKKSFLLGHGQGHGYGHGQGHSQGHAYGHDKHLKHGGGYSYQVKQKLPYGHQQHHWNFEGGFPPGHMGGAFPPGHVKYMQDCTGKPNQPLNAMLKCTSNSNTCKATCMPDYKFPNGETNLLISCVEGEWIVQGAEWPQVPSCEPIC
uniref:Uncharacterized protein n=1 Tax=Phlebotomus papatasi TaxID=29031 RepID=A0A1B0D0P6_PHLPP